MKKIFLTFFSLFCIVIQAQTVLKSNKISAIVYNEKEGDITFYATKGENKFIETELEYNQILDDYDVVDPYWDIDEDEDNENEGENLSEILYSGDKIIYTEDIRPTQLSDFLGKAFIYKEIIEKDGENERKVVKILNNYLASVQTFSFSERHSHSFERYINKPDDNQKKWRCRDVDYYSLLILDFGKGRKIYLFNDEKDIENVIIPLKNGNIFLSYNQDEVAYLDEDKKMNTSYESDFKSYSPNDFFYLLQENKKYKYVNFFATQILGQTYDSINASSYGIITQKGDKVEVFNNYLKKIDFRGLKTAHFYREGIEILDKKGPQYYGFDGEKNKKFFPISYAVCGTVGYYDYKIQKDFINDKMAHIIEYKVYGPAIAYASITKYVLEDIPEREEISFINGEKIFRWNGNSSYIGEKYGYPELIRVKKAGKYGLVKYDLKYTTNSIQKINGKVVLPFEFDDIKQENDGLIYIFKNNKVGIYPQQTIPEYNYITKKTNSFYQIKKNGKEGYLDIKTFKEYF